MKSLLQKTFESSFNESYYKELVTNLFNHFDFSKGHTLKHQFTEAEKQVLNDFIYLGTYDDSQNKNLDVLIAELKGGTKVERARSLQRNLIGKYLKSNLKDSALVAFYSKDNPDWRLSFVKMDYRLDEKGVKTEIGTPTKRYSFLVGKTEPSHTAQKQLLPLLDDKQIPLVGEIEKIFSIEKVTKEFYTEIAKKFTELVGGERKIGSKKVVEKGCIRLPSTNDDTIEKEFAVRLIGRLLFCWFLKKKKSEKGEPLLTSVLISSDAVKQEKNYYHRFLEPLFFQVLNTPQEKRQDCFRQEFWGKIPFLNGGLFEPHRHDFYEATEPFGHSKHINTLKIPDEWFLELFKLFELYNFTIDESTTIDVDISVDPEMLGRIFENLLAEINPETGETARKSTGSYYTPRPIVEYMVDESLKQYLKTQTRIDEVKLASLLSYAEDAEGFNEAEEDSIIDALDRVKIIDPACGSGAFPMGILHKMLLILQKIDPESKKWLTRKLARIDNKLLRKELESKLKLENWDYVHKLGIIQNSIYGVDIQPIAVEISKLRFFLSLIVDEKIDDNKPNRGVVPLPNLEFKFVAANSLIGLPKAEGGFAESHADIEKLKELREAYFISYGDEKREIERKFGETQHKMFLHALNWQATGSQTYKLSEWNPFADETASWFDPEWMFGVKSPYPFAGEGTGEGGFDVVIGNPPYVRVDDIDSIYKETYKSQYQTATGKYDMYYLFFEKGVSIICKKGIFIFITPNKFCAASSASILRKLLFTNFPSIELVSTSKLGVFKAVSNYPVITKLAKQNNGLTVREASSLDALNESTINSYHLGTPSLSGLPEYIIPINASQKHLNLAIKLLKQNDRIKEYLSISEGLRIPSKYEKIEKDNYLIVKQYQFEKWTNIRDGSYISKNNLSKVISSKSDRFIKLNKQKILIAEDALQITATIDDENCVPQGGVYFGIAIEEKIALKIILGILNSKLLSFIYETLFGGMHMGGGYLRYRTKFLEDLPIPHVQKVLKIFHISSVNQILAAKKKDPDADTSTLEKQIDEMVYALYGLTPEEIAIVEGER